MNGEHCAGSTMMSRISFRDFCAAYCDIVRQYAPTYIDINKAPARDAQVLY